MVDMGDEIYDEIGRQRLGPFVVSYCQWVHEQKKIRGLDNIAFLARDGFLIRKVYQILYPEEQTYYIRLSRKALRLPFLVSCRSYQEYIKILPPFKKYSVRDFLGSIYHGGNVVLDSFPNLEYEIDYKELVGNEIFQNTYKQICDQLEEEGQEQKELLVSYLKENGICVGKKVGLVERSFKGTSQYMLEKIMEDEYTVEFAGLYFYGNYVAENRLQDRYCSFLKGMTGNSNLCVFEKGILTERLIFEPCASVKGYRRGQAGIVPVLENYTEDKNNEILMRVQKSVLYYAEKVREEKFVVNRKKAIKGMLGLLKHPTRKEAGTLGYIEDDNLKERNIKMICTRPFREYLKKPYYLLEDVKESIWRQGFLALLPMGCLFRELYNFIFCITRRKGKK